MKANYEITYSLDIQGEACPMPAIATLEALPQLKKRRGFRGALRLSTGDKLYSC